MKYSFNFLKIPKTMQGAIKNFKYQIDLLKKSNRIDIGDFIVRIHTTVSKFENEYFKEPVCKITIYLCNLSAL